MTPVATALFLVLLLQVKHYLCDGPLQTKHMVDAKGNYGEPLGILHAGFHAAGTLVVFAATGFGWNLAIVIAAVDFALHYHIDYVKEYTVRRFGWSVSVPYFWWMMAFDQFLHHLTYLAFVAYALQLF